MQLKDVLRWYSEKFKDPMVVDPPEWFQSFIFCEALIQLPFFPIAAYAFLKGGWKNRISWENHKGCKKKEEKNNNSTVLYPSGSCRWIRTPAMLYAAHVITTLIPILSHILFHQFPGKLAGPQAPQERWLLFSIYVPYLLVPLLLLLTMLLSSTYNSEGRNITSKKKKK